MQYAVTMYPSQLAFYKRPCLRDGCKGTHTITKTLGHHVIIETVMDTFDSNNTLMCYLNDVSEEISIESNKQENLNTNKIGNNMACKLKYFKYYVKLI